jgi:hypothetical protein
LAEAARPHDELAFPLERDPQPECHIGRWTQFSLFGAEA